MGIKGFLEYLRKKFPQVLRKTSIYTFHKCKIAIDASFLGYTYWSPAHKATVYKLNTVEELDVSEIRAHFLKNIWAFLSKLLRLGITPIIVFDGPPPKEKNDVISKRVADKKIARDNIDNFIASVLMLDPILRTKEHVKQLRELYMKWNSFTSDQMQYLRLFCMGTGIPMLDAINEAEELCCALCRDGVVSAVYCKDTDCLAHGCPVWIYSKDDKKELIPERNEYIESFEYIVFDEVLQCTGLSKETFVDWCIMSGCDYNVNIPNCAVGNSYNLLKKCSRIENTGKPVDVLNHLRCRELFKPRGWKDACIKSDVMLSIDFDCLTTYAKEYLFKCEMDEVYQHLDFIYAAFPRDTRLITIGDLIPQEKKQTVSVISIPTIVPAVPGIDIDLSNLKL